MRSTTLKIDAPAVGIQEKRLSINLPVSPLIQKGVTLIELMVGIAIGLLVIAVAMGALMISRGISGTVSDASNIQQQAAYAMRVIGMQARQAGSLRINLSAEGNTKTESPYNIGVAIEIAPSPESSASSAISSFDAENPKQTVTGTASPDSLLVGYRRYTEPVFVSATEQALSRNCLGGPADSSTDQRIENIFWLDDKNQLRCAGNEGLTLPPPNTAGQPLLQNVADFQVRYLLQDNRTTPGNPTIRKVDATAIATDTDWARVQAVEVCFVLYGTESISLPQSPPANDPSTSYRDCNNALVDMRTLTAPRTNRMHMAFRNIFQLRSQGLIGTVL
ncbi:PilW family protein [Comamonas granuli]|uniref:PilW family protein n=1 Tax=Comamonas granuli TaxID=290309 RepID=UPI000A03F94C|nr:PilW family protein [Comamonas granuli]